MVVDDLDIERIPQRKPETHPKLIVDPDAVIANPVAQQPLKPIVRRDAQIIERAGAIQHRQLSHSDRLDVHEFRDSLASI